MGRTEYFATGQPGHRTGDITNRGLAGANARKRGITPMYESLAATARAKLAQIESERVIEENQASGNQDLLEDE